jgi:hypothetical protein
VRSTKNTPAVAATNQAYIALYMVQRQAAMVSFVTIFRMLGILFLVMIPFVLLMKKPKGRARRPLTLSRSG